MCSYTLIFTIEVWGQYLQGQTGSELKASEKTERKGKHELIEKALSTHPPMHALPRTWPLGDGLLWHEASWHEGVMTM